MGHSRSCNDHSKAPMPKPRDPPPHSPPPAPVAPPEQALVDAAVAASRPSVFRPVLTNEAWGCVGRDAECQWVDPMFAGPGWGGHLLMFEFPREGLARKMRKEVDRAVHDLQSSLVSLSRIQRGAIVRMAVDGLPLLT